MTKQIKKKSYIITSIHFPEAKTLDRIKKAAGKKGMSVSSFLCSVAERAADDVLGGCPRCGSKKVAA